MSDEWISWKNVRNGVFLLAEVARVYVQAIDPGKMPTGVYYAPTPQQIARALPQQGSPDLAARLVDGAWVSSEAVHAVSPDSLDAAQEAIEKNQRTSDLNDALGDVEDRIQEVLEKEEKEERQEVAEREDQDRGEPPLPPEVAAARQRELDGLLAGQQKEQEGLDEQLAGARSKLEDRYEDSPAEQEQHLGNFDQAADAARDALADRHAEQIREFDDRWQPPTVEQPEPPPPEQNNPNRDDL